MLIIDVTLKATLQAFSVQRKDEESAQALYQQILAAMQGGGSQVVELTCDREPHKKIAILSQEISAVQVSEKTSTGTTGRSPGFWAQVSQS